MSQQIVVDPLLNNTSLNSIFGISNLLRYESLLVLNVSSRH